MLFVGTMQGLVLQSLLSGNTERIRAVKPEILKVLLRSMEPPPRVVRSCRPSVI